MEKGEHLGCIYVSRRIILSTILGGCDNVDWINPTQGSVLTSCKHVYGCGSCHTFDEFSQLNVFSERSALSCICKSWGSNLSSETNYP